MAPAASHLLALLLLSVPLLVSCTTCSSREVYEAASSEPEKCWECPEIKDAFEHGKSNIHRVEDSYDNFFCKYTISVERKKTYIPANQRERINQYVVKEQVPIYCYYGKDGRINDEDNSDKRCKEQANAVPNCTPVEFAKYTGPYEVCCRPGCELESPGRCFHCPLIGGDFVDVDIKPGFPIECTYHGLGGSRYRAVSRCYFDPVTGKAVSGYKGELPCDGNTAMAPQRNNCRDRLPTCPRDCKSPQQCWECPKIAGKSLTMPRVKMNLVNNALPCRYNDAKAPSPSKRINCLWEKSTGKAFKIGGKSWNSRECPITPACLFDK